MRETTKIGFIFVALVALTGCFGRNGALADPPTFLGTYSEIKNSATECTQQVGAPALSYFAHGPEYVEVNATSSLDPTLQYSARSFFSQLVSAGIFDHATAAVLNAVVVAGPTTMTVPLFAFDSTGINFYQNQRAFVGVLPPNSTVKISYSVQYTTADDIKILGTIGQIAANLPIVGQMTGIAELKSSVPAAISKADFNKLESSLSSALTQSFQVKSSDEIAISKIIGDCPNNAKGYGISGSIRDGSGQNQTIKFSVAISFKPTIEVDGVQMAGGEPNFTNLTDGQIRAIFYRNAITVKGTDYGTVFEYLNTLSKWSTALSDLNNKRDFPHLAAFCQMASDQIGVLENLNSYDTGLFVYAALADSSSLPVFWTKDATVDALYAQIPAACSLQPAIYPKFQFSILH